MRALLVATAFGVSFAASSLAFAAGPPAPPGLQRPPSAEEVKEGTGRATERLEAEDLRTRHKLKREIAAGKDQARHDKQHLKAEQLRTKRIVKREVAEVKDQARHDGAAAKKGERELKHRVAGDADQAAARVRQHGTDAAAVERRAHQRYDKARDELQRKRELPRPR